MNVSLNVFTAGSALTAFPNINNDSRALPADASGTGVFLDLENKVHRLTDKQLYELKVSASQTELSTDPPLKLNLSFNGDLFRFFNQSALPLSTPVIDLTAVAALSTKTSSFSFFIEAQSFEGTALNKTPGKPFAYTFSNAANANLLSGTLQVNMAQLILSSDLEPPGRLYIADLPGNQPSIIEVSAAMRGTGVSLVKVPADISNGDSWLQDQFQMATAFDNLGNQQQVILHLPRIRSDVDVTATIRNLSTFTNNHFPSRGIGVFKDFWKASIPGTDSKGSPFSILVSESNDVATVVVRVNKLNNELTNAIDQLKGGAPSVPNPLAQFYDFRAGLANKLGTFSAFPLTDPEKLKNRDVEAKVFRQKISQLDSDMPAVGKSYQITVGTKNIVLDESGLNALTDKVDAVQSSHNYGGNVEVSPPFSGSPFGTIVTGEIDFSDVQALLGSLPQDHVEVTTRWLDVGHIDEISSFVPSTGTGFAIMKASPNLALAMVKSLKSAQDSGILVTGLFRGKKWSHVQDTTDLVGNPPPKMYTDLLRSKLYDLSDFSKTITVIPMRPTAYRDDRRFLFYFRANRATRFYAAHLFLNEIQQLCVETNRTIDDLFLSVPPKPVGQVNYPLCKGIDPKNFEELQQKNLTAVFSKTFSGIPILPLPVIFDNVASFATESTKALSPGLVNLQQLNKVMIVPKPYGPRMRPDDAITWLTGFLSDPTLADLPSNLKDNIKKKLDKKIFDQKGLDHTVHWVNTGNYFMYYSFYAPNSMYREDIEKLEDVADVFKDGFDEFRNWRRDYTDGETDMDHPNFDYYNANIKKIQDQIAKANPGKFDKNGYVQGKNWVKLTIPENTVDVFEVYTQALLEALGLTVHFVDSWYYHVNAGGIHCGTNVLRQVDKSTLVGRIKTYNGR